MATTLFHWTLHPWAIYAVVGLAIAYGVYRKGRLQLITAAFEPLHRRARERPLGQGHRHAGDLRHAVRLGGLARPRRAADQQRPGDRRRARRGRQRAADRHHRRADRRVHPLRGVRRRQGHPVALEHQHGARPRAGAVRLRRRPDGLHPQPDPDLARQLPRRPADDVGPHRRRGRGRPTPGCSPGRSSTGRGGSRGRRSSACSSRASRRGRTIRQFVTGVLLVPSLVSLVWFCIFGGAAINLQQTGTDIAGAGGIRSRSCSRTLEAVPARPPSPASW